MKTFGFSLLLLATVLGSPSVGATPEYPLHVSDDGRRILDASDHHVFFNMESGWFLLTQLTREEVAEYFDNRVAKGFNAILIMFPMPEWDGEITNRYGEAPFLSPGDFSAPNEAYWQHADWVVTQAHERGLTLFLAPAYLGWGCVNDGFCDEMRAAGTAVMRDWGRWIGARYRDQPNIVWVNGGDTDAGDHGVMDVVDAVAYGIRDVDDVHLHTAHCARYHASADCYDRPWLDINATYADCSQTPAHTLSNYLRTPHRPIVFIEGRYEYEYDWTDVCMRSQAYWSLLEGASGHTFGSGVVHLFSPGWEQAMESTGSQSMIHFARLVATRPWPDLVPDTGHTVLVDGYGDIDGADFAAAARTKDGRCAIVYSPVQRTLTVDLTQVSGSLARAWWFDPVTGEATSIGDLATDGPHGFDPPSAQDWVLVLDDAEARFPAPGQDPDTGTWGSIKSRFSGQ